jgi:hypothetical protein
MMKKQRILPTDTTRGGLTDSLLGQWHGDTASGTPYSLTSRSVDAGELARQAVKKSVAEKAFEAEKRLTA